MLSYMRKNAGSWVIRLLLFGIAVVFAFWGIGTYSNENANTVLTVDRVKVPYSEYRDIYNALVDGYRKEADRLDADAVARLDIKGQAIDVLLQRYILLDGAERLGISAVPEEVAAQVSRTSAFQEGGVFSPARYQAFLEANRLTAEAFERTLARDLTILKVSELVQLPAAVTPQEVEEDLLLLTRKVAVRSVDLDPNDFLRGLPEATDAELEDLLERDPAPFRVPERFTVAVVRIDPASLLPGISVPPEEVEDAYEERKPSLAEPASYRLRHIQFAFPSQATAESIAQVRGVAEDVSSRIRRGELTFERAASQHSADRATAAKGGDLGFLSAGELDPSILEAVDGLEDGEVSDPIPTAKGFEVVSVAERKEERVRPFEEVKAALEDELAREEAVERAYDLADDLLEKAEDRGGDLASAAAARGLAALRPTPFSRERTSTHPDLPKALLEAVFETEQGESGKVFESESVLYLFQTVERSESYQPPLAEVRGDVAAALLVQRALDRAYQRGTELARDINDGRTTLEAVSRTLGRPVRDLPPFSVMESDLPEVQDGAEELVRTAFALARPGQAAVSRGKQGHRLVVLKEIVPPDEALLAVQRATVEEALRVQRRQDLLAAFVEERKEALGDRIVVNNDLL